MTDVVKVVSSHEVNRASLRKTNPATSGHTAVVYLTKRGSYVLGKGKLTMGELWLNTPQELYTVDVAPHQDTFTLPLPSREEAFSFTATVRVTWRVTDPVAAVTANLADPRHSVQLHLEERLREVTREFGVEASADAERRVNREYGDLMITVNDAVTVNRCTVVLTLDESTSTHIRSRTLTEREQEQLRQKESVDAQAHVVALQAAAHQRQLEELQARHELELRQQRMRIYADALRTDNYSAFAAVLTENSEDAKAVIALMMEQKQLEFTAAQGVLDRLLAANMVNRKDIAVIMDHASKVIVGNAQGAPPPLPVEAKREEEPE